MVRLLRRAAVRSNDPDLFAALVHSCRYSGLLPASLAAHERARRLDKNVRTSVAYTLFMAGDYARAAAESTGYASIGGLALVMAGDARGIEECRKETEMLRVANMTAFARLYDEMVALLEDRGHGGALEAAADAAIAGGLRDPEGLFFLALPLARFGQEDRAIEILQDVVDRGYVPCRTFRENQWFGALRDRPEFVELLPRAEHRHQMARAAFVAAGGEALLGAGTASG